MVNTFLGTMDRRRKSHSYHILGPRCHVSNSSASGVVVVVTTHSPLSPGMGAPEILCDEGSLILDGESLTAYHVLGPPFFPLRGECVWSSSSPPTHYSCS